MSSTSPCWAPRAIWRRSSSSLPSGTEQAPFPCLTATTRPLYGAPLIIPPPLPRALYRNGLVPEDTLFIGYARSKMTSDKLVEQLSPWLKV